MNKIGEQSVAPRFLIDRITDVAIEVAIGAFADAEGPMDIERDRRRYRPFVV